MSYAAASAIRREVAELVRPRQRLPVSEAARRYVRLNLPGGFSGPLDPALTPYMVEPMDLLASRAYLAVVFAGPAQSGKTAALVDGWVGYMVVRDSSDMQIIQTSHNLPRRPSLNTPRRRPRNRPGKERCPRGPSLPSFPRVAPLPRPAVSSTITAGQTTTARHFRETALSM